MPLRRSGPMVLLCALLLAACGGNSSSSPSSIAVAPLSLSGNWTGTFTFTPRTGGQREILAATASFTQGTNNFTGQVQIPGANMQLSGVATSATTFDASVQFNVNGCVGTASVSGTGSASQLRFSIPTLASASCTFFSDGDFLFNR